MKKADKLKEQVFTELNKRVQFDLDTMMLHFIANKTDLVKEKISSLRAKIDVIEILINELEHETKN